MLRTLKGGQLATYDAFISYSHSADGKLAPALQVAMQRLAKPWSKRRALEVFRDETGLAVNPDLWGSIVAALDASEWFVLLASPEAAASKWVDQEIDRWLERSPDAAQRILPVLTSGTMAWDETTNSFTADTDAAPPSLYRAFTSEPRHIDLSWAKHEQQLDLGNPRFRQAVAEVAAPMHQVSQDELIGEDISLHRKSVRLRRMAVTGLGVLTVSAMVASVVAVRSAAEANEQRAQAEAAQELAEENAAISASREYAALSTSLIEQDTEVSALLAVEAMWPDPARPTTDFATDEATSAVRNSLNQLLLADSYRVGPRLDVQASAIAARPDGAALATIDASGVVDVWDVATGERLTGTSSVETAFPSTGQPAFWGEEEQLLEFSPDGSQLLVASDRLWTLTAEETAVGQPIVIDVASSTVMTLVGSAGPAAWLADGSIISTPQDGSVVYRRPEANAPPEVIATVAVAPVTALVPMPSGALVVIDGDERPWHLETGASGPLTALAFANYDRWSPRPHTDWAAGAGSDTLFGFALGQVGADDTGTIRPPEFDVVALDLADPSAVPAWAGDYPVAAGTLAVSSDGAFVAAANGEWELGLPGVASVAEGFGLEVRVWNPMSPLFSSAFVLPTNTAADIEWLPGGRVLALASGNGVEFLQIGANPSPAGAWALSADAEWSRLATWDGLASGVVTVWDSSSSAPIARYQGDTIEGEVAGDPILGTIAITPDGSAVAATGYGVPYRSETSGRVEIIDLASHDRQLLPAAPELDGWSVGSPLVFGPAGDLIFSEVSGGVAVALASTGEIVSLASIEGRTDVLDARWSPDGAEVVFIAQQDVGRVLLSLDVASGGLEPVELLSEPHSMDLSADGSQLAIGLANGAVVIVDRGNGEVVRTLTGHTSRVSSVDFSNDGDQLLSADGALLLRSIDTGATVWSSASVPAMTDQSWLLASLAPDGGMIAAGGPQTFAFVAGLDPALACRSVHAGAFDRLSAITGRTSACERIPELIDADVTPRQIAPATPLPVVTVPTTVFVTPTVPLEEQSEPVLPAVVPIEATRTPDLATIEVTCRTFTTNETLPIGLRQRGVTVATAQLALADLGFVIDVDGCFGPGSEATVIRYQSERGIAGTGVIDAPTWQLLIGATPD